MTGFGQVRPLPEIWDSFYINTPVTSPAGVEAHPACALRDWLTPSSKVSRRTSRSTIGSLLLSTEDRRTCRTS